MQERAAIDGVQRVKMILSDAKKQHQGYQKIWGKGFIQLPDGTVRMWSGDMTRKFNVVDIKPQP